MSLTRAGAAVIKTEEIVNNRNRIINGDMRIAQRGTSANPTTAGYFTVDRWVQGGSSGVYSSIQPAVSQSTDAPQGFANSYSYVNTNAYTLLTTESMAINQEIEGFNVADLGFGTASAQTVTVSFWVKSSLTGKFPVSLRNSDTSRIYTTSYTINATGTWEHKTVTIPGDTSGTWLTNNGRGIRVFFFLGSGPDRLGTTNVWSGTNVQGPSDMVQLTETAGATFQITGVQLEVGSVATPFERRPFGTELSLCQRYFYKMNVTSTTGGSFGGGVQSGSRCDTVISYPVEMRATPTFSATGTVQIDDYFSVSVAVSTFDAQYMNNQGGFLVNNMATSSFTTGRPIRYTTSGAAYGLNISAEL